MRTPHVTRSARPARVLAGTLLAASLALAGCAGAGDGGDTSAKSAAAADAADTPKRLPGGSGGGAKGARAVRGTPRLAQDAIIRTATLSVQVKDVAEALEAARTAVGDAGGYVGTETTSRDRDGHEHTRVVLRVPTERYDEVLAGLQGAGRVTHRTAKAVDVTDQVVDVRSRITSQRASVARIRALMDKADKLSDVVSLEGELSSRQADLEALLARQASLKDRTSLATITLSLSRTPVEKASDDGSPGFADALAGGWHAFVSVLRWIALALGAVLPFAVLAALLTLVWRRVVRPRLPRRAVPAAAGPGPLPSARPVDRGQAGRK